jgi:hypothetical protein
MRNLVFAFIALFLMPVWAMANSPPVADAGEDVSTLVDEPIYMDGTATDPDGDPIVSWLWSIEQEPAPFAGSLVFETYPNASFQGSVAGEYILSLVVGDGMDLSEPDFVTITVSENLPPTAVASANVTRSLHSIGPSMTARHRHMKRSRPTHTSSPAPTK